MGSGRGSNAPWEQGLDALDVYERRVRAWTEWLDPVGQRTLLREDYRGRPLLLKLGHTQGRQRRARCVNQDALPLKRGKQGSRCSRGKHFVSSRLEI